MRIAVIHPHLDALGGSEILTSILVSELARRGFEVAVVSRAFRGELFPRRRSVRYFVFSKPRDRGDPVYDRIESITTTLHRVYDRFDPDVALVMIQEPVYALVSKTLSPGLGVGMYIHFPYEEELTPEKRRVFLSMYRFPGLYERLFHIADIHMTNSAYTASVLYRDFGIESNIVYPTTHWDFFEEKPPLSRIPGPRIVSVGRFVPHKRHDLLIRVFAERIKREVPEARLTIVGIPDPRYREYYEEVRRLADRARDVELIDKSLSPREMIEVYRSARAYVHLRIGEHFGMAPLEAMSQGAIPVVPAKSGFSEVIVDGVNGYTFSSDSEWAGILVRILRASGRELYRMRRRAYLRALQFSPDRFAGDVVSCLRMIAR